MDKKGSIFDGRFKIKKKLGQGSFGSVFKAKDLESKEYLALKIDNIVKSPVLLMNEVHALESLSQIEGIPKLITHGRVNEIAYFAVELLGKALSERLKKKSANFSLGCVLNISRQLLKILEEVHKNNYIHRDIKPSNLMTGCKKPNKTKLFLIDFGLAKRFRDPLTKQHELYRENRITIGNLKYASANSILGIEQSRRDDLESWFYLQVNFLTGSLPWDKSHTAKLSNNFLKIKSEITPDQLCEGCPGEFIEIIKYIKSLKFDAKPDYSYLESLLEKIPNRLSLDLDLDWTSKKRKKSNDFLCIQTSKKKEIRRSSQNFDTKDLLSLSVNLKSPSSSSKSSVSGSLISTDYVQQPLSVEESKNSSEKNYKIEVHEDREEDLSRKMERADTIKNVYPEFKIKHVHFIKSQVVNHENDI